MGEVEENRGRPYLMAYDNKERDEYLHAFAIYDGGTRTWSLCKDATRYRSDSEGKVRHTDEDKPENLCPECQDRMEREPPIGTQEHHEWVRGRGRNPRGRR